MRKVVKRMPAFERSDSITSTPSTTSCGGATPSPNKLSGTGSDTQETMAYDVHDVS